MTPESANICSQLLTLKVATRRAQNPAPAVRREAAAGVTENDGLASIAPTVRTTVTRCSFLYRNTLSWRLAFGLGSSDLDPKLGGKKMASEKAEKCAHPLCSCVTTSGKYCSAECQATEKTPEIACACPHTGCKGKTH